MLLTTRARAWLLSASTSASALALSRFASSEVMVTPEPLEVSVSVEPMEGRSRARAPRAPRAEPSSAVLGAFGLDAQDLTKAMARRLSLRRVTGVLISDVERGGAAARAGLSAGQVILSVNQREVASVKALTKALKRAGETALLRVWSDSGVRFVVLSR